MASEWSSYSLQCSYASCNLGSTRFSLSIKQCRLIIYFSVLFQWTFFQVSTLGIFERALTHIWMCVLVYALLYIILMFCRHIYVCFVCLKIAMVLLLVFSFLLLRYETINHSPIKVSRKYTKQVLLSFFCKKLLRKENLKFIVGVPSIHSAAKLDAHMLSNPAYVLYIYALSNMFQLEEFLYRKLLWNNTSGAGFPFFWAELLYIKVTIKKICFNI